MTDQLTLADQFAIFVLRFMRPPERAKDIKWTSHRTSISSSGPKGTWNVEGVFIIQADLGGVVKSAFVTDAELVASRGTEDFMATLWAQCEVLEETKGETGW